MNDGTKQRSPVGAEGSKPLFTKEEIAEVVGRISQVLPAGNVPEMVLSGLMRLGERKLQKENVTRDLTLLMRAVEGTLDKATYLGFFGGPAAAIWAYQELLALAGKEAEDAFPEGVWQFYVGYALREDTARHTNETHGFDTALTQHQIQLDAVERMAAWVMAAIVCLHQYDEFLATEWKERTATCILRTLTQGQKGAGYYADLYRQWGEQKPYSREEDAVDEESYPVYRWNKFKRFIHRSVRSLPPGLVEEWKRRLTHLEREQLPRYQAQMSILTTLTPGSFEEVRQPIPLDKAQIGVIYRGHYYLIPVCEPGRTRTQIESVLNYIAAMVSGVQEEDTCPPVSLTELAQTKRAALTQLWPKLSGQFTSALSPLASTPILLNFDAQDRNLPLAKIRQTERGLGNHPLTVIAAEDMRQPASGKRRQSFIFDQSHIFFDGAWGAAFAEIMTNEAISWAVYLQQFPLERYSPLQPIRLSFSPATADRTLLSKTPKTTLEASAETDAVNLRAIVHLRKLFKMRSDLLHLTVNDLLVLYRAIHALTYQPSVDIIHQLRTLLDHPDTRLAAETALHAMTEKSKINPTVLIPVDASVCNPQERVHPMSFEVPLAQLDLLHLHAQTIKTLNVYDRGVKTAYVQFDDLQRKYLLTLASLGEVFHQAKEVAISGQTASVSSLKMLAHLPMPLQKALDSYSGRFGWVNDLIKGREVFSNIGRVVYTSTLSRFMTAKDDNDQKDLAWGVLTDQADRLYITLRDFRPHVPLLAAAGHRPLADAITQDYLNGYASGLNQYIRDLHRITVASRETKLSSKAGRNPLRRKSS